MKTQSQNLSAIKKIALILLVFVATLLTLNFTRGAVSGQVAVSCPGGSIPQMRNCGGASVCTYNGNCGQLLGINCCGASPAITNTPTLTATATITKTPTPTSTFMPTPTVHPLLLAWYTFNEGSGTTLVDYKAYPAPGNNGVLTTFTNPPNPWVTGGISKPYAMNFDGNADHVYVASSDIFSNLTTKMTVLAWIKPSVNMAAGFPGPANWSYISHRNVGGKADPDDQQFEFGYSGWTGALQFKPFNGNTPSVPYEINGTPQTLNAGQWYHVAGVLDGNIVQIYENAVLKGQRNDFVGTLNDGPTASHMTIGGDNYAGNFMRTFNGVIDEFRIYSTARTQPEIYADMHYWDTPTPIPITNTPSPTPTATCGLKYTMTGNQIAFEAENETSKIGFSGNSWADQTDVTASNALYSQALTDTGRFYQISNLTGASRQDYAINFPQPGNYTVWVKIKKASAGGLVHFGVDQNPTSTADNITTSSGVGVWGWTNVDNVGAQATIFIASAGEHIVNIWEGEDGVSVDKIIITQKDITETNPNVFEPASATYGNCPATPTPTPTFGVKLEVTPNVTPQQDGLVKYEYFITNDSHAPQAAWAFTFVNNLPNDIIDVTWKCEKFTDGVRTGDMNAYPTTCSAQAPDGVIKSGNRVIFGHTGLGEPLIHPGGKLKITVTGKVASTALGGNTISHVAALSPYPTWGANAFYTQDFFTSPTPLLINDSNPANNKITQAFVIITATKTPTPTVTQTPPPTSTPTSAPSATPTPVRPADVATTCVNAGAVNANGEESVLEVFVNGDAEYYCQDTNGNLIVIANGNKETLNSPNTKISGLSFKRRPKVNNQELVTVTYTITSTTKTAGSSNYKSRVYSFTVKLR